MVKVVVVVAVVMMIMKWCEYNEVTVTWTHHRQVDEVQYLSKFIP